MILEFKGSPNKDKNRKPIDRIVLHWFGVGDLEAANKQFQKPGGTSAHYGISGEKIYQWVLEKEVAYHAGDYPMNQRSVGIEHHATKDMPASDLTYTTSIGLVTDICRRYDIPPDRTHILKHSEVVPTQCPGTLDITRIIEGVKRNLAKDNCEEIKKEKDKYKVEARDLRDKVIKLEAALNSCKIELDGYKNQTPKKVTELLVDLLQAIKDRRW